MLDAAFYVCLTLIVLLSAPIWQRLWRRLVAGSPLLEPRWRLATPIGLVDVCLMFFVWFSSQIAAGLAVAFMTGTPVARFDQLAGDSLATLMLVSGFAQVIAVVGVLICLSQRYGDPRAVGWQRKYWVTDCLIAGGVFLLSTPLMLAVQVLLSMLVEYEHPALDAMFESGSFYAVTAVALSAVVGAPIAEEVLFRGVLQGWLQRLSFGPGRMLPSLVGGAFPRDGQDLDEAMVVLKDVGDELDRGSAASLVEAIFELQGHVKSDANGDAAATQALNESPYAPPRADPGQPVRVLSQDSSLVQADSDSVAWNWVAIILPSALFALAHLGQGLAPIPLFGLSIVLGYLFQRTGSLLPSIGLHMLVNGYSVVWLVLQILFGQSDSVP